MKPAHSPRHRRPETERGVVLVELALVLPLLTALLLTIVDLGLVLREYQIIQNAAREGARYSIHPPNWIDWRNPGASDLAIRQRVVEYLQQEGIMDVGVASVTVVQTAPIAAPDGLTLEGSRVTVTYTRQLLIAGGGLLPVPQVTLTAEAVFRNLY